MRKLNSKFITKYISEAGGKNKNKDYFGFVELDNFACWAVAESYDNDNQIISARLAVETALGCFTRNPTLSKRRLKSYVKEAHKQLKMQSGAFQLKASLLIVATDYKTFRYALCGNTRLYVFRGNGIFLKSHDQSLYQRMIDNGDVPDDEEHGLEEARNLLSFLGKHGRVNVSASKKMKLFTEDILIMSTWGFWEKITALEMLDAIDAPSGVDYLELDELNDLFLSKQEGLVNNYTVAAIFVNKTFEDKGRSRKILKIALIAAGALLAIVIVLLVIFLARKFKRDATVASVKTYIEEGDSYSDDEDYSQALVSYDAGLTESRALKESSGKKGEQNKELRDELTLKSRVARFIIEGDDFLENGDYEKAEKSYRKALASYNTLKKYMKRLSDKNPDRAKYSSRSTALTDALGNDETSMVFSEDEDLTNETVASINNDEFSFDLFDVSELEDKIAMCGSYADTGDLIRLADSQVSLGQIDAALRNYQDALNKAVSDGNKQAEKDIKLKLESAKSLQKSNDVEKAAETQQKEAKETEEKTNAAGEIELAGDKAAASAQSAENYNSAIRYYNQAIDAYAAAGQPDKAIAVTQKIEAAQDKRTELQNSVEISRAEALIMSGDLHMLENDAKAALDSYRYAQSIYIKFTMAAEATLVNDKISAAELKIKENDIAANLLEINAVEREGDEALLRGEYDLAKNKYYQAQTLYQGIGRADKAAATAEKINSINALMIDSTTQAASASYGDPSLDDDEILQILSLADLQ
ncbi:MAG: hypothetical protein LBL35_08510 [Clostridiales bacterium]|jgi:serine/threonine protein phosphatase PrpC|nr:hypothetical protein [Clostridiales bacterium]